MEMRGKEEIGRSEDITPALPPLAYSLYSSFLSSHCSSCFCPLSLTPSPSPSPSPTTAFLRYCSKCSTSSPSSSSEQHLLTLLDTHPSLFPFQDSSHLRLALRFLHILPASYSLSPRILGLLTNYQQHQQEQEQEQRLRLPLLKAGAKAIALARARAQAIANGLELFDDFGLEEAEAEAVLCLVITNAVDIVLHGHTLGVALYDHRFSWINHSCSPNSCFRFISAFSDGFRGSHSMRIFASGDGDGDHHQVEDKGDSTACELAKGVDNHGPRIIVRSIQQIQRGEEVTITYTDLLQPTALRQSELFLEYKFFCNCERCRAIPQAHVDHALQEMFCVDHEGCPKILQQHDKELAFENLKDMLDSTIGDYMEAGDPVSCCEKVERILSEGLVYQISEQANKACHMHVKLSPLHSLSLNAYTTLISTYKIRAELRAEEKQLQSTDMSMTSAAYSLLLAGVTPSFFVRAIFDCFCCNLLDRCWTVLARAWQKFLLEFVSKS